ncbi:MAG: hypothetical protein J0L60_00685 [Ignavibacteria bacterium]|nr:hypothetical protein [Ignavibacteria bacterium]
MKKFRFAILLFLLLATFSVEAQTQPEVELPSFVITGLRSYDFPAREKINPDFYSILSDGFKTPKLADSVFRLTKNFDPKVTREILRDTSEYTTGYASGSFGNMFQPSVKGFISAPMKDVVLFAGGEFNRRQAFVENADETNFKVNAGFKYYAYNDSLLDPGTEYFANFRMSKSLYQFYGSDDPSRKGDNSFFNPELGFRNLSSQYLQYGGKIKGDIFAPNSGDYSENIISAEGFFNTRYEFVEIFSNLAIRQQNLTDSSGNKFNNNFINLSGLGGIVIGRTMKLLGGIELTTTPDKTYISPVVKYSARFANGLFLIASYNPSTTIMYNQDRVAENQYFHLSDSVSYSVLRKTHDINAVLKFEYEKLIEFEAGASWFMSDTYPFYTETANKGFFTLGSADVKGITGFVSAAFHPGILGRFVGEVKFNSVKDDSSKYVPFIPQLEFYASYGNNYNKIISYDVRLGYISKVYSDIQNKVEVEGGLDLSVNVEYNLTNNIKLFGRGTDLLNTKLMKWGRYQSPGLSVSGGVVFSW